jgi:biotin carboxylase
MGETIRAAGIRAVKQLQATIWSEIEHFIVSEWRPDPFKVIVKPMDSAGSDDVTLCNSLSEVRVAFGNIMGKVNGLGLTNKAVLVQEYLEGQEFVVDMVSRDGDHKVVAIWAYDRRPVNGAQFVCHGQRLLTADEPFCRELIEYQKRVVTALGIRHGPTHGEVKWCKGEPVLVEVGARCHGGEGSWVEVANAVYGYNQADVALDSYLNPEAFHKLPTEPVLRLSFGRLLFFVVKCEGVFREVYKEYLDELLQFSSTKYLEFFLKPGAIIRPTKDCFSWGGLAKFVNDDLDELIRHYDRVREMEDSRIFFLCD